MEAHPTSSDGFDSKENPIQLMPPCINKTLIDVEALSVRHGHRMGVGRVHRGKMSTSSSTPQFPSYNSRPPLTQENK
ncbi:hypothetical protein PanWU01x14_019830 [Parasponia andersonii]|uniref:Uncharacterized protein n=1 Tax=Parasponia andersonii TaxID=3476 RepID=A0A2P5DYG8_PARAD|nr:hypothetical protein PanWU01x14_019830 [Parasponia andersonii]